MDLVLLEGLQRGRDNCPGLHVRVGASGSCVRLFPLHTGARNVVEEGESQDTVDGVHVRVLARQVWQQAAWAIEAFPNTQGDVLVPDLRMLGDMGHTPHVLKHTHTRAHSCAPACRQTLDHTRSLPICSRPHVRQLTAIGCNDKQGKTKNWWTQAWRSPTSTLLSSNGASAKNGSSASASSAAARAAAAAC